MSVGSSLKICSAKIFSALFAGFLLAAFATALSPQSAAAAYAAKSKRAAPVVHRGYHGYYATYGWPRARYSGALPYGPENGFLHHVPPNAIQMPGYTFVPGVGILGESCDLPTSACTNEYRDIR